MPGPPLSPNVYGAQPGRGGNANPGPQSVVATFDAPTRAQGGMFTIPAGQSITFRAKPAPFHRKQLVVKNRNGMAGAPAALNLQLRLLSQVQDADGSAPQTDGGFGYTVGPGEGFTIFTSDTVRLTNGNAAGNVEVNVTEVIYI